MVLGNAELLYVRNIYLLLELTKIEVIIPNRGFKNCATHRTFHRIIKSVLHMLFNSKIIKFNIIFTVESRISSRLIRTSIVFSVRNYNYNFDAELLRHPVYSFFYAKFGIYTILCSQIPHLYSKRTKVFAHRKSCMTRIVHVFTE